MTKAAIGSVGPFIVLIALLGCDGGSAMPESDVLVPIDVSEASIPRDGTLKAISNGKIIVAPDTLVCIAEPRIDPSLAKFRDMFAGVDMFRVYDEIGQNRLVGNASRHGQLGRNCRPDPGNVSLGWQLRLNGAGKPYRIVLIARQGQIYWQGIIDRPRLIDIPPGLGVPADGTFDGKPYWSVEGDKKALSTVFENHLINGSRK
jgi:hypothetical protein